jgi:hypothetical protein
MTSDLAVNVHERLRVSSVFEVDWGQEAFVTITLDVIEAPPVLIEGVGGEHEAFDRIYPVVQSDCGVTQRRTPPHGGSSVPLTLAGCHLPGMVSQHMR